MPEPFHPGSARQPIVPGRFAETRRWNRRSQLWGSPWEPCGDGGSACGVRGCPMQGLGCQAPPHTALPVPGTGAPCPAPSPPRVSLVPSALVGWGQPPSGGLSHPTAVVSPQQGVCNRGVNHPSEPGQMAGGWRPCGGTAPPTTHMLGMDPSPMARDPSPAPWAAGTPAPRCGTPAPRAAGTPAPWLQDPSPTARDPRPAPWLQRPQPHGAGPQPSPTGCRDPGAALYGLSRAPGAQPHPQRPQPHTEHPKPPRAAP